MKIELVLLGLIAVVIAIDFLVKKRKKSSSKEIEKFQESETSAVKKPAILKWAIISLAVLSLGSLVVYQIVFAPKTYKYAEVTFNNNLAYLKTDMSLLTGEIKDNIYKGLFVNGKEEGFHRRWHKNGQIKREGNYINGKGEGLHRWWYKNGQLEAEGNFVNNNNDGLWRLWFENGQLKAEGNYVDGEMEGLGRTWNINGKKPIKWKIVK